MRVAGFNTAATSPLNRQTALVSPQTEREQALRRMKWRKGRRDLPHFENLPVTTHVYELSAAERACPGCGQERNEIGAEKSWQVEYVPGRFEWIQHVRKKVCLRPM
jgi:transposase